MASLDYTFQNSPEITKAHKDMKGELTIRIQSELAPYLKNSVIKIDLNHENHIWTADVVIDSTRGFKASRRKDQNIQDLFENVISDLRIQFALTEMHRKTEMFLFDQQQEYDHYTETLSNSPFQAPETLRVLVVEDDPTALLILEKSMKSMGCEVDLMNDPEKAVMKMADNHYDLVILDWCLPYMNGHDFLKKADEKLHFKNQGNLTTKAVPLVICSSKKSDEINLPLVSNFIFCQYWNKQLPFSTVISSIETAIKSARQHKTKVV